MMKTMLMVMGLAFTFAVVAPAIDSTIFAAGSAYAKNGADDPAGHDAGDDHGGHGPGHK